MRKNVLVIHGTNIVTYSNMSRTDLNIAIIAIKSKLPLSRVVGIGVVLQKKGREFVGQCPFHLEKTGSFFVNDEKGTFYCFGCGAAGDIIDYVIRKDGIQFRQALEKLAEMAGVKLPEKIEHCPDFENRKKFLQKTVEYFKCNLLNNKRALKYCEDRGINRDLIERFSVGYSGFKQQFSFDYFKQYGFSDSDIAASGLFIQTNDDGTRVYPRFIDRIMFPVIDKNGWPIAFGGRSISENVNPKYLNSPETDLFQKRKTLYGYNIASKNASEKKRIIIVEGYIDVVMMHKFGFDTAVAVMGTAFSPEHLAKVWRYSNEPIVCMDGDDAGYRATIRLMLIAMQYLQPGKSLRFCILPNGVDPDSLLNAGHVDEMQSSLADAIPLIDFFWEYCRRLYDEITSKTPENIAQWNKNINMMIDSIQDPEIKRLYKYEIKNRLFIILRKPKKDKKLAISTNQALLRIDRYEKVLLKEAILLYPVIMQPSVVSFVAESLSMVSFSDRRFEKIKEIILNSPEDEPPDFSGFEDVVEIISSMCRRSCNVTAMSNSEILSFWNEVFKIGFIGKIQQEDVAVAKKECDDGLSFENWERLKAIKMDSLYKKSDT
ncbi:MAG: DNA primase [Holosporales bacterium]|jgi:DNA primase|nr:DNA primase [Holosporales bacterium]